MHTTETLLGGLSAAEFLRDYWQKQPLVVRGALAGFDCPVSPEELGGLALEEDVESRLIQGGDGQPWVVRHGPFSEGDLTVLPASHWTLLVQEINKHVPEFALLQERFGFIPNWRLDDVMVSFAPEHGSVGPHADNYDVFLIQGPGRRRWQLSWQDAGPEALLPDLPLRVLRDFRPEVEYVLEPGDMLYLPPGVVHHGVSLEDATTISVGYRAPAVAELVAAYCADTVANIDEEFFYADPELAPQSEPGLIDTASLARLRATVRENLERGDAEFDRWFAGFTTGVRPGHYLPEPEQEIDADVLLDLIETVPGLYRSEYARYAFIDQGDTTLLYVAGEEFALPPRLRPLAVLLSGERWYPVSALAPFLREPEAIALLTELYNIGALYPAGDLDD